jgi:hypothetical protein
VLIQLNQLLNISVDLELIAQTKEKYSIQEYLNKERNVDINANAKVSGYLLKKGQGIFKRWKKCWFVVKENGTNKSSLLFISNFQHSFFFSPKTKFDRNFVFQNT